MHTLEQLRSGALTGITRLNLSCGLREFPREIFTLADTLEILDLSGNQLSALPDDLPRLHQLRILFCSDNLFTELPPVLGQCAQLDMVGFKANRIRSVSAASLPPALRWLILTDNQIAALPAELGRCTHLQKLMLAGNQLHTLPPELARCTRLELLRIAANHLPALPDWLLAMPRLTWLAYAGNPFCDALESTVLARTPIAEIAWHRLRMQHRLGEGASGVIHQASWQRELGEEAVAVKLFKGALTSDGLPQSEMAACLRAGVHTNLIPLHGKVNAHPSGAEGLVMSLIHPRFGNLAAPPSLASCTRDVYADDLIFTPQQVLRIALGIAAAAQHLHAQGILHGDLYAHNILHDGDGHALLGDFGAASFFDLADPPRAAALQRLEVRAFGCLLEELISRCPDTQQLAPVSVLQARCSQENSLQRPLFGEVLEVLRGQNVF